MTDDAEPVPGRRQVGQTAPASGGKAVGVDGGDRALRLLAPGRDDAAVHERGTRAAAGLGDRGEPRPASPDRVVGLEARRVRVDPGAAPAEGEDARARGGCGQVLARRGAGNPGPAAGPKVERERDPREGAAAVDAADDVELAARDRRRGCAAGVGQSCELAPASPLEHEDAAERQPVAAVPAHHVDTAVRARRGGMVDRDRQVGEAAPAVGRDRVGVGTRRVAARFDEPADGHDLTRGDGGCHLGARLRQGGVALPGRHGAARSEPEQGRPDEPRSGSTGGERSSQSRAKGHLSAPKSRC